MLKFIEDIQSKLNITESQFARLLGMRNQSALRVSKASYRRIGIKTLIALYRASGDTPAEFLARLEAEANKPSKAG